MTASIISFSDFVFRYEGAELDDWRLAVPDFQVRSGQITIISGDNMSGKSTFLNILSGLLHVGRARGSIKNGEGRTCRQSDLADHTILLSSDDRMFPELSVAENIVIGVPSLSIRSDGAALHRAQDMMAASGIFPRKFLSQKLGNYSSGGRALVKLGRAYASNAQIVVVDELSSFLDQARAYYFLDAIIALVTTGRSAVIVSHNDRDRRHILSKTTAASYHISRDAGLSTMEKRDA